MPPLITRSGPVVNVRNDKEKKKQKLLAENTLDNSRFTLDSLVTCRWLAMELAVSETRSLRFSIVVGHWKECSKKKIYEKQKNGESIYAMQRHYAK